MKNIKGPQTALEGVVLKKLFHSYNTHDVHFTYKTLSRHHQRKPTLLH